LSLISKGVSKDYFSYSLGKRLLSKKKGWVVETGREKGNYLFKRVWFRYLGLLIRRGIFLSKWGPFIEDWRIMGAEKRRGS